ncbi:MAG: hypothetical protein RJB66_1959 [Pseudomonadota bacterium]|jgi:secreted trypsin-like serine protease
MKKRLGKRWPLKKFLKIRFGIFFSRPLYGLFLGLSLNLVSCANPEGYPSKNRNQKIIDHTIHRATDLNKNSQFGIVGGTTPQAKDQVRWSTVGLYDLDSATLCTGTIIGEKTILTAAHCVQDLFSLIVFFGDSIDEMGRTSVVTQVAVLSTYSRGNQAKVDLGDVAVVEIADKIPATHNVAELISSDEALNDGEDIVIVGYGATTGLQTGTVGSIKAARVKVLQKSLGQTEFVTNQSRGTGACFGDSGGPAYAVKNNRIKLVGIASRVGNSQGKDPCRGIGIYSKANFYQPFVDAAQSGLAKQSKPSVESR